MGAEDFVRHEARPIPEARKRQPRLATRVAHNTVNMRVVLVGVVAGKKARLSCLPRERAAAECRRTSEELAQRTAIGVRHTEAFRRALKRGNASLSKGALRRSEGVIRSLRQAVDRARRSTWRTHTPNERANSGFDGNRGSGRHQYRDGRRECVGGARAAPRHRRLSAARAGQHGGGRSRGMRSRHRIEHERRSGG